MITGADTLPDDVATLRAAIAAEQLARREAEARASGAEAMVAHLKLLIAKLRHEQFGASSERGRKLLDQLELQLEELEAGAAEDDAALGVDPVVTALARDGSAASLCVAPCPPTCRASGLSSLARPPARAARVRCPSWART